MYRFTAANSYPTVDTAEPRAQALPRAVLQLPAKLPGNRHGTLPLHEAEDRRPRMRGRDLATPVDMSC